MGGSLRLVGSHTDQADTRRKLMCHQAASACDDLGQQGPFVIINLIYKIFNRLASLPADRRLSRADHILFKTINFDVPSIPIMWACARSL